MATSHQFVKSRKKPVELSTEELAALEEGIRSEREDPICNLEEAFEFARKRREQWKKTKPSTTR